MDVIDEIIADLSVPYKDLNILTEDTQELRNVNYFFDSICCGDKALENLLYEKYHDFVLRQDHDQIIKMEI